MTKLIPALLFSLFSMGSQAGTFSYNCSEADINCDGLLGDYVTDKYTNHFSHQKYQIHVYSDTQAFSDGTGVSYGKVGVTPISNHSHIFSPNRWWTYVTYSPNIGNAYKKKEASKRVIIKALEAMMAECDDTKNCSILD